MSDFPVEKQVLTHHVENPCSVNREYLEKLLNDSVKEVHIFHGKQMVVSYYLPCGFTVTGESNIIDPEKFNFDIGEKLCYEVAIKQLWQLETYRMQCNMYSEAGVE
jgi:hypothetical protein